MKKIIIVIISILTISFTCKKEDEDMLLIKNMSNNDIYIGYSSHYPDTSLNIVNPLLNVNDRKIKSHTFQKPYYGAPTKNFFYGSIDTLILFVFDANVLETIPWDTIKSKHLVLKRYDLSLEDLEEMNWIVNFP